MSVDGPTYHHIWETNSECSLYLILGISSMWKRIKNHNIGKNKSHVSETVLCITGSFCSLRLYFLIGQVSCLLFTLVQWLLLSNIWDIPSLGVKWTYDHILSSQNCFLHQQKLYFCLTENCLNILSLVWISDGNPKISFNQIYNYFLNHLRLDIWTHYIMALFCFLFPFFVPSHLLI